MKVLRLMHSLSRNPKVKALSAPAFRWLFGLCMEWTGYNNGVIEFTRSRHGTQHGLGHREVFTRARSQVLATDLVMRTRVGGRNLCDLYALTNVPNQAAPPGSWLGARRVPVDPKPGAYRAPTWDASRPKKTDPHITIARASDLEKNKVKLRAGALAEVVGAIPDSEAYQGGAREFCNGAEISSEDHHE